MTKSNIEVFEKLKDFLTFYHEYTIPKHPYFDIGKNQVDDKKLLVVSSPSRMGNHLLMSMLDNHPELPRIPGEDGILSFTFFATQYDFHDFITKIKGPDVVEHLKNIASNGGGSKWEKFNALTKDTLDGIEYSGTQTTNKSAILDFKNVLFDINYEAYNNHLMGLEQELNSSSHYNQILFHYLDALLKLDYAPQNTSNYTNYMVYGGMRTQLLWLCETVKNAKILCSIRHFDSYAISQIKSKNKDAEISPAAIQIAWEHWYHKVIDLLYLKCNYPDKIGLVLFEDMIGDAENTCQAIADFLSINFNESMLSPTIFGNTVGGNSWNKDSTNNKGNFYKPSLTLDEKDIPTSFHHIYEQVVNLALK